MPMLLLVFLTFESFVWIVSSPNERGLKNTPIHIVLMLDPVFEWNVNGSILLLSFEVGFVVTRCHNQWIHCSPASFSFYFSLVGCAFILFSLLRSLWLAELPKMGPITQKDIEMALENTRPSAHLQAHRYEKFNADYGSQILQWRCPSCEHFANY